MTCGLYIHIPFCRSKCNYCHFVSVPFSRSRAGRYAAAVIQEIAGAREIGQVDSIYFGGGTPSLVPPEQISDLLKECRKRFQISSDCEISLESNPGTLTVAKLKQFRKAGISRISMGAQTFADKELQAIGRIHDSAMILDSIRRLRDEGFSNINLDLMLGLPGQTEASWKANLRTAADLELPHISVYMLDLDESCALSAMVANREVLLPDDDLVTDLYLETIEFFSERGYRQYEISNFALPGARCRHNLKYWQRLPVYGFGAASHSFDGEFRYSNHSGIENYIQAIETGGSPVSWREKVDQAQSLSETLFLGLRLTQGVDWQQLQSAYGMKNLRKYEEALQELSSRGFVEWTDSSVRLTRSGMLVSNEIFQIFV